MNLVIAEKPDVGRTIAEVLGLKNRKDGYIEGEKYIVTWCIGHLVSNSNASAYGEEYLKWSIDSLPIIPNPWKYDVDKGTSKQFKTIKGLMHRKDVNVIICATDAGREGELIFRLVYEKAGCKKPIKRLWISSLEESAINKGLNSLKEGSEYDNLYHSALCRSKADWLVGINATRLYSVFYGSTLSVGRVMTPTLAIIVDRFMKVSNFIQEKYYVVSLGLEGFKAVSEKIEDSDIAKKIREVCIGADAECAKLKKEQKSVSPPKLFDLTLLQREANRIFSMSAQQTLDVAQKLYESKLITYPRTDSNFLTSDMEQAVSDIIKKAGYTDSPNVSRIINDSKVTDHHAILPTLQAIDVWCDDNFNGKEADILALIFSRLFSAVSEKHLYESTVVEINCSGYKFIARGRKVIQEGWKEHEFTKIKIEDDDEDDEHYELPEIIEGQVFRNVQDASVVQHFTKPPKQFTENTLLSAMENVNKKEVEKEVERKGIGTPATRASIIEKLIRVGYIIRKGKQLLPTKKGISLISIVPENIKSPSLTAEWENELLSISKGELSHEVFMDSIEKLTRDLIDEEKAKKPHTQVSFSDVDVIGKCPRCNQSVISKLKSYICEKDCGLLIWKENNFLKSSKKKLTEKMVKDVLKNGSIKVDGLVSKSGKTYSCEMKIGEDGKLAPVFS